MTAISTRKWLAGLASSVAVGALAIPASALAQDNQDDQPPVQAEADLTANDQDPADGEAIVVTGSRIARRDLTSTSPMAVVQDEEFRLSGAVNVEQVINTLPQVIPGVTGFSNNPGGGIATLDLRGLGSQRTLILVNGRRWMFFDPSQTVDLNTIPQFLIDSVDVVTGGASAVYGSDAVSGVVNFRLRSDLEGIEVGGSYSLTEEGDGARYNAHVAVGSQFADGRGSVTAFAEYYNRSAIFAGARDFARFSTSQASGTDVCVDPNTIDPSTRLGTPTGDINADGSCDSGVPGFAAAGSSTTETLRARYFGGSNGSNVDAAGNPIGSGEWTFNGAYFAAPGVARQRTAADQYNYAPQNYLMVPQERWLLGGYAEYEIAEDIEAFMEVSFVNNRVSNELAATPVTGNFNFDVAQTCQFVSATDCASLQALDAAETVANAGDSDPDVPGVQPFPDDPGIVNFFIQRRILETGDRGTRDERNAFRALTGLRGQLTDSLNYEVYYFYSRTRNSNVQEGNISTAAFQAGLDGTAPAVNIFGPGTLTPAMVNQISILAQNNTISNLQVANASISGPLANFGLGADDVGFAVGVEWRSVYSRFIPDTALSSGDVIGFNGGLPTEGGYDVREAFAELRIPIIADRPFFDMLELNGAARYSDYSLDSVGGVWTYAAGVEWAPVADISFRGQYQRAIRAPNVGELFGGRANGFPPATDPCAQAVAATDATIRQLCIQTGVPAPLVGNPAVQLNAQIEGIFGGNPNLEEEVSDTWTAGVVLRPSFVPRLNITIDGYDISVENAIAAFGGGLANTLNLCYNIIQDINSPYCQAFVQGGRDPRTGIIGGDFSPLILNDNVGALETRGIDFQVDYSHPLGFSMTGAGESRLSFFVLATYVDRFDITPVSDAPDLVNECAGRFGALVCANPVPKWKWTTRLSLLDGPVTVSGRWRHLNGVRDDDDDTAYTIERIGSYDLFDLSFAFDVNDNLTLNMGVNNLFDRDPPILGVNQEQSNTYPATYDVIGRDFFVSANFRF